MIAKPFQVLLCAKDRTALQQTTKLLEALGYVVCQTRDTSQAASFIETTTPDYVIFDEHAEMSAVRSVLAEIAHHGGHAYSFLLIEEPASSTITEALDAGIDDFLTQPVVFGELLARLRAGARSLEHQRRVRQQSRYDTATGLRTERAIARSIAKALAADGDRAAANGSDGRTVHCVAWNLDLFRACAVRYGRSISVDLLSRVVAHWTETIDSSIPLGHSGRDQFFAVLVDVTQQQAVEWADNVRNALAAKPFQVDGRDFRLTASFGVAPGDADTTSADDLLRRATDAQRLAKRSGRNCVRTWDEVQQEENWWNSLATPVRLFERTVARDFMKPWTMVLKQNVALHKAKDLFEHTRLSSIPVVDDEGKFVGLCFHESFAAGLIAGRVVDVMETDVKCVEAETPFEELFEFFESTPESLVVVLDGGQLAGVITRNSISSLMEPLDRASFAARGSDTGTSDYLVVRDAKYDTEPF